MPHAVVPNTREVLLACPALRRAISPVSVAAELVRELVAQALWPGKGVHPARRCDARQLFEALNEQPKSHVQHREEGELHVFHYNQKVQNTCAWTPELLLALGHEIDPARRVGLDWRQSVWPRLAVAILARLLGGHRGRKPSACVRLALCAPRREGRFDGRMILSIGYMIVSTYEYPWE